MMAPACESGLCADEKEASENAMNLKWWNGIGLMVMVTSWNRFASWRILLAYSKVEMVAVLIANCKRDNLLDRSDRVFVAAC